MGANINEQNSKGETPLMIAIQLNQPNLINLLFTRGVDVNLQDNSGQTAVYLALEKQMLQYIDAFLQWRLNVNKPRGDGTPLLHVLF